MNGLDMLGADPFSGRRRKYAATGSTIGAALGNIGMFLLAWRTGTYKSPGFWRYFAATAAGGTVGGVAGYGVSRATEKQYAHDELSAFASKAKKGLR